MKNPARNLLVTLLFISLIPIVNSCKKHEVPTLTTSEVTNITGSSATSGGEITDEGSGTVVERGICWSKGITPTIADNFTLEGGGVGTYVSNMTNLDAATAYFVRAYAKNEAGIGYGMAVAFNTLGQAPSATTQAATDVTATSAILHGAVNANYVSTTVSLEYGTSTSYGSSTPATPSPVTGSTSTNVSANLAGLSAGTTYHFRIKTVNSLGTTNGTDMTFTTLGQAPTANTQAACCLSSSGAKLNGSVNPNYLSTTVTFEYGLTNAYGNSVTATQSPVTGNSATSVSAGISGLNSGTTYHFRIKAVNSLGTSYGDDMAFSILIADIDGNLYQSVKIGNQVWLASNLKTTKYSNGDVISSGIYVQGNDLNDAAIYGRLYTWTVAVDGRNVCPTGWHVPSEVEWNVLLSNVISPADLKEQGLVHWFSPNTGATNSVSFTALPGGYFDGSVTTGLQAIASFWFKDEVGAIYGRGFKLYYNNSPNPGDYVNSEKNTAFSVRCLKD